MMFSSHYARKTKNGYRIDQMRLRVFERKWVEAKSVLFNELVELAKVGKTTDYTNIGKKVKSWDVCGLHCRDSKLHYLLGEISLEANEKGFPLLSGIVFNKKDNEPGAGYWHLLDMCFPRPVEGSRVSTEYARLQKKQIELIYKTDWSGLKLEKHLFSE